MLEEKRKFFRVSLLLLSLCNLKKVKLSDETSRGSIYLQEEMLLEKQIRFIRVICNIVSESC